MMTTIQKALFFFFVIVLAFLPGGIFISVFLLALYYLVPSFTDKSQEEKLLDSVEFTVRFEPKIKQNSDVISTKKMDSYSKDTLEEMK